MSKIRVEVEAENLEELRKNQKDVIKNFIKDHEIKQKVLKVAEENLVNVFEKLEEVSNLSVYEFKDSEFYSPKEVWGTPEFLRAGRIHPLIADSNI